MSIGEKLQRARMLAGLTQEQAAERMSVSRQTISNWENDKTLPDIAYAKSISEVYGVSIDQLISEDHPVAVPSTVDVKDDLKKKDISGRRLLTVYLCLWLVCVMVFWIFGTGGGFAMVYGLFIIWLGFPIITAVIAFLFGLFRVWQPSWLLLILFFGVMHTLLPYMTFSLANTISSGNINPLEPVVFHFGVCISAASMAFGLFVDYISNAFINKVNKVIK